MRLILTLLTLTTFTPAAHSQSNKAPLTITAEDTLEWDRANQTFTANGKAMAKQDTVAINASKLTAAYKENKKTGNDFDIHTMTAEQNVIITSDENKAYGDNVVYDLTTETAIMTGSNLRLITPEQTIKAQDQFEYHVAKGKLVAKGDAKIIRPEDTLRANIITAYLTTDQNGKRTLDRMTGQGNVIITTKTEKITGTYGTYNAKTEQAEITGGVTITRGPNILKGDRATVNLRTQISKIFSGQNNEGRVSGTFYPSSKTDK